MNKTVIPYYYTFCQIAAPMKPMIKLLKCHCANKILISYQIRSMIPCSRNMSILKACLIT